MVCVVLAVGVGREMTLGPFARARMGFPKVDPLTRRWHNGRKVGRMIYAQLGAEATDDDPSIGLMDTVELALEAVQGHNALLRKFGP